jgi:hypothetical protein
LVLLDLDYLCKSYKRIKKIEKNKRKEEKKGKKRNLTETAGPAQHRIDPHGPTNPSRTVFSLSLIGGAHLSASSSP